MKYLLIILLTFSVKIDPRKLMRINAVKSDAHEAYISGDYKTAIAKYKYLMDSLDVKEDAVMLNLANAYYLSKDSASARTTYQSLTGSDEGRIRSRAHQQLGVMDNKAGKAQDALDHFKQAIKADLSNGDARYNYEMLKRKLEQKDKEDQKKDQDKDKQDKKQEPSEYAKRLKEQADRMVAQHQYQAAYNLMMDGMKKDQTVSSYQDYINRLKDVADIAK